MRDWRRLGPVLAGALVGFAWGLYRLGLPGVDPTNVTWLLVGDWAPHELGFLFFRNAEWQLPIGATPNFAIALLR